MKGRAIWIAALLLAVTAPLRAQSGAAAYRALGIRPQEVLTGTVLQSQVLPGSGKQVVCIATYFTGKKEKSDAINIRLGVFSGSGDDLRTLYTRDFGAERGGNVANGDLQLIDLDLDKVNEIVVSFDTFSDPLVEERVAEVILHDGSELTTAWTGAIEYDATRAARTVPAERRDRFVREFDWGSTMRTRGATLFVTKKMVAVAGERLAEPREVRETFRLRGAAEHW